MEILMTVDFWHAETDRKRGLLYWDGLDFLPGQSKIKFGTSTLSIAWNASGYRSLQSIA
jgi:hypothetical protein